MIISLLILGVICGFLNSAASGGSLVILPIMIFLGIPPTVANATFRLPILIGSATSIWKFQKASAIPWSKTPFLLLIFVPMSLIGAAFASMLPNAWISTIIKVSVVIALIFLLIDPKRALTKKKSVSPENQLGTNNIRMALIVGICGMWLGLVVIDAAILLLLGLVYFGGLLFEEAVPIKSALIFISSIPTIILFMFSGDINWVYGATLSLGSIGGAILGSSLVLQKGSSKWIHILLTGVVIIEAIKMFF